MTGNQARDLGRVEGKLDALISTIEKQGEQARESRRELYTRIGSIETDIKIGAGVDAQVRDRLDKFEEKIDKDVMPTINEVKRWKIAGMTVIGMAGVAGAALMSLGIWLWDVILTKIKG